METKRVARLIIYEGESDAIAKQLSLSLPEGLHKKSVDIIIINLDNNINVSNFVARPIDDLYDGD